MGIVRRALQDLATVRVFKRASGTLAPVTSNGSAWWPFVREPFGGAWQRNMEVSTDLQLAFYAVYACETLISNDIGKLRQRLVEKKKKVWSETTSPAFSPVLRKPNRFQNHIQFKQWWMTSKLTKGNAYALKARDGRGIVIAEYLLDPDKVTPLVAPDGSIYYRLQTDNLAGLEEAITIPQSEIIHDRMNCLFHPLVGVSPLYACGTAAAQGLAIQSQSRNFFGNGARPSGILTAPGEIAQETADRLKEHWENNFTGANAGRVAVLGDGLTYTPMTMSASEAQTVEQLHLSAEMVCAAFHVPPFKIGLGQQPTYQNGEILNQGYYDQCLQVLIEEYELCQDEGLGIGEGVIIDGRELGVELDLRGLLRMDSQTQMRTLAEGVKGSLIKIDEAREELDREPVPGGDEIWSQAQNYSLTALAERDRNDPFAKPPVAAPVAAPTPAPDDDDEDDDVERALEVLFAKQESTHA